MKEYIQVKGKGIKVSLNELIYSSYVCIVCEQALHFEWSGEQEALSCAPRVWLFTVITPAAKGFCLLIQWLTHWRRLQGVVWTAIA